MLVAASGSARLKLLLALVAVLAALALWQWWPRWPAAAPSGVEQPVSSASQQVADAAADRTPRTSQAVGADWTFQTTLLPDALGHADPASVRIGIARVSAEDAAAWTDWQNAGAAGAGPATLTELAQVESWLEAAAALSNDRRVQIGPLALPVADRYVLVANSPAKLVFYRTSFTRAEAPATVTPLLAAGLRIVLPAGSTNSATVLLRRLEQAGRGDEPAWQALLADQAPALLAAYGEQPLAVPADGLLAPLPPGPVEVIVQWQRVAAQTLRADLVAGQYQTLTVDPVAGAVAARLGVTLELQVLAADTADGIADVQVRWTGNGGTGPEQHAVTARDGRVRFDGVERLRTQQFTLEFPAPADTALPRWPGQQAVTLTLDVAAPSAPATAIERHTVRVPALHWLLLDPAPLPISGDRRGGQPYPVFVLQQQQADGRWIERAAEHFLVRPEGLAVSVTGTGPHRVLAFASPWQLLVSTSADPATPGADGRHRVQLQAAPERRVQLRLTHQGRPLPHATVLVLGSARGLPPVTLTADAQGRLLFEQLTVPALTLEVAGLGQVQVATDAETLLVVEVPRAD